MKVKETKILDELFSEELLSREQEQECRQDQQNIQSWNQDFYARLVLFGSSWVSQRACMFMNWYSAWLAGQHCHVRAARNAVAFPAQRIFPEASYHPTSLSCAGPVCFSAATPFRLYKKQNMKRVWRVRQEWTFSTFLSLAWVNRGRKHTDSVTALFSASLLKHVRSPSVHLIFFFSKCLEFLS